MNVKTQYTYTVAGIPTTTREAARIVQRSLRTEKGAPRIVQKVLTERVIR